MNTYFISTYNKKDLDRIKKILQRYEKDFTLNSKHFFIIYYIRTGDLPPWVLDTIKNNGAIITPLTLHQDHPSQKTTQEENYTPLPFRESDIINFVKNMSV
jgi:hypothetical protein